MQQGTMEHPGKHFDHITLQELIHDWHRIYFCTGNTENRTST